MLRAGLVIACLLGLFSNHGVLASGASEADESGGDLGERGARGWMSTWGWG